MMRNGKMRNAGHAYRQGGIGMRKLTALLLALAMALAMLGAAAEGLDEALIPGESVQANDEAITVGNDAAAEDGEGLGLAGDAILDGEVPVIDELSLDGLEDDLLSDGLPELEIVAEDAANALAGNESKPEDFEIDGNGVLVKYKGAGGDVVIPDRVTAIGNNAFRFCDSLPSVTIPDSVTHIGQKAFEDCKGLASVTIGAGLSIEDLIYSCLLDIDITEFFGVTENNAIYASRDGVLYTHDMRTLLQCPEAKKSVTIPDSVKGIGDWAFAYCNRLKNVIIPDNVTSIGVEAFYGCTGMKDVYIPASVKSIGKGAFRQYDWEKDRETNLDLAIHGYAGSYAETYARKNGLKFSAINDSLARAKVTVSAQVYTGKALKPAVKVVLNGKTLKKGKDYTVSYKNNKAVGKATVIVTGKGAYTGTAKATFRINPKAVTGLKLTAGMGRLGVSWKKGSNISGYQLQYGLKKDFSGAKKATVSKASTVKSTIKNLKTGKTYYVRIRAWKNVGKTTYWSAWSETKKAKVG